MDTLKQQYLDALIKRGWFVSQEGRSKKYLTLTHCGKDFHVYLGSHGAVRLGKNISSSHGMSETGKLRLLMEPVKAVVADGMEIVDNGLRH